MLQGHRGWWGRLPAGATGIELKAGAAGLPMEAAE